MTEDPSEDRFRQELTGGEALIRMFQAHGLSVMFGMAGFQLLPMYDGINRLSDAFRHILIKDERDGAFMADAYARVSGIPGLCDGTLGPGATNLITGLAESYNASIPVVAVAGEVNVMMAGRGATQESDQWSMIRPTVKEAIAVDCIERIPEQVRRAYGVATAGRGGPVLLNVRENVAHATHKFAASEFYAVHPLSRVPPHRARADQRDVLDAAELLQNSRRPILLVGGGVHLSGCYDDLQRFAEDYGVPVATTISGKGSIPEDNGLSVGVFGRFSRTANDLIKEADCILVVGCKLGEIATNRWSIFPPDVKIIQADIDPAELGRNAHISVGLWSDAGLALRDLYDAMDVSSRLPAGGRSEYIREIKQRKKSWLQEHSARIESDETPIEQARMLGDLSKALPSDSIVVADAGFAAHWSAIYYEVKTSGRHYIANRGNASIGYGLPGAIGAQLAAPDQTVVALTGDGGLGMSIGELETAVREKTPIVVVVVDNQAQGYVKALQHALYEGRFQSADYHPVDYSIIAESFGLHGERVDNPDQIIPAVQRALEFDGPSLIDIMVTTDPGRMLPAVDARSEQTVDASK